MIGILHMVPRLIVWGIVYGLSCLVSNTFNFSQPLLFPVFFTIAIATAEAIDIPHTIGYIEAATKSDKISYFIKEEVFSLLELALTFFAATISAWIVGISFNAAFMVITFALCFDSLIEE